MLAKKYRLTKRNDFKAVFSGGKRFVGRFFSIRYLPNALENSRFAVVASNKVSKLATRRNRLKRQVREIIRLNLDNLSNNCDVIVNILSSSLNQEYQDLEAELLVIFKKSKLIQ